MKNKLSVFITLAIISFSTTQIAAYPNKTSKKTAQNKQLPEKKAQSKKKKPEYYRGHSDGLQNWPGKTISHFDNTGMRSTNDTSYMMGNDISF